MLFFACAWENARQSCTSHISEKNFVARVNWVQVTFVCWLPEDNFSSALDHQVLGQSVTRFGPGPDGAPQWSCHPLCQWCRATGTRNERQLLRLCCSSHVPGRMRGKAAHLTSLKRISWREWIGCRWRLFARWFSLIMVSQSFQNLLNLAVSATERPTWHGRLLQRHERRGELQKAPHYVVLLWSGMLGGWWWEMIKLQIFDFSLLASERASGKGRFFQFLLTLRLMAKTPGGFWQRMGSVVRWLETDVIRWEPGSAGSNLA